jgi:hypothetical protein
MLLTDAHGSKNSTKAKLPGLRYIVSELQQTMPEFPRYLQHVEVVYSAG